MLLTTIITGVLGLLITLLFLPLCLVIALLPERIRYGNRLYFFLTSWWNTFLVRSTFSKVRTIGREHLPTYPTQPAIFVMNHTSALDIPLVEYVLGSYPRVWIAKEEYARLPLFGTLIRRMHVPLHRESSRKGAAALAKLMRLARLQPNHLILFPEGTRSDEGVLLPFNEGFALLSKKLDMPVIPLAIRGAGQVLPRKGLVINPRAATIELIIGTPFTYAQDDTNESFTTRVRDWFVSQLAPSKTQ